MKMRNKKKEQQIQEWIETTAFDQLNSEERSLVLSLYSKEEYEAMQALFQECKESTDTNSAHLIPDPNTLSRLNAAWDAEHQSEKGVLISRLLALFTFRVQSYQVAVIALLALAVGYFISPGSKPEAIEPGTESVKLITQTDTVYLYETISREPKKEPVVLVSSVKRPQKPKRETLSTRFVDNSSREHARMDVSLPSAGEISSSFGNSAIKNSELEQFTTQL